MEIQPVHPKGNQSWIFIGRTDAEAEIPILWPPDVKNWLIGKDPDTGKDWRKEEKGMTEDEMVGWHHRLNGHEFEQAPGFGDGQGSLVCCSPLGLKESNTTEWLTWICHEVLWSGTRCPDLSFFECWVLSQLFHTPLSPSLRGSLVSLWLLPLGWCHLHTGFSRGRSGVWYSHLFQNFP